MNLYSSYAPLNLVILVLWNYCFTTLFNHGVELLNWYCHL